MSNIYKIVLDRGASHSRQLLMFPAAESRRTDGASRRLAITGRSARTERAWVRWCCGRPQRTARSILYINERVCTRWTGTDPRCARTRSGVSLVDERADRAGSVPLALSVLHSVGARCNIPGKSLECMGSWMF